jgi:hypothetical protein
MTTLKQSLNSRVRPHSTAKSPDAQLESLTWSGNTSAGIGSLVTRSQGRRMCQGPSSGTELSYGARAKNERGQNRADDKKKPGRILENEADAAAASPTTAKESRARKAQRKNTDSGRRRGSTLARYTRADRPAARTRSV